MCGGRRGSLWFRGESGDHPPLRSLSPLMRSKHFLGGARWAAVALIAFAGFAAFGDPGPTSDELWAEAAEASMGHTSGGYAGLAFAMFGDEDPGGAAPARAAPYRAMSGEDASADAAPAEEASHEEAAGEENPSDAAPTAAVDSPTSGWLSQVEVRALVGRYFQPEDVNRAIRIAWCESRFDPDSVNLRTGGVGLFQHLPKYWEERAKNAGFAGVEPTDAEASTAAAAWEVYKGGGWDVFGCRG